MNLIGPLQESGVSKIIQADAEMQSQYRKYFDLVMDYDSLEGVFVKVQRLSNQLWEEPQWVPASWHNIIQRAWTQHGNQTFSNQPHSLDNHKLGKVLCIQM